MTAERRKVSYEGMWDISQDSMALSKFNGWRRGGTYVLCDGTMHMLLIGLVTGWLIDPSGWRLMAGFCS